MTSPSDSGSRFEAWRLFLKERSPVVPMLVISGLMALATRRLHAAGSEISAGVWDSLPALGLAWVFVAVFLTLLRIMDEVKDIAKDRVIHPERPLARGLISESDARGVIRGCLVFLALLSGASATVSLPAAVLLGFTVFYGYAMYREFWLGEALGKNIFVFGLSHQLIVLPLYASITALAWPEFWSHPVTWLYAGLAQACSFSFEMSRKLDPQSAPLARTYAQVHGRSATCFAIALCLGAALALGWILGLGVAMAPLVGLQLIALALYWFRPQAFRVAEVLSVATSLGQLLAPLWLSVAAMNPAGWFGFWNASGGGSP